MVRTTEGTLIECDEAARELILFWSQKERFVLKSDLGPRHLLVKSDAVPFIQQKLREHNDELHFTAQTGEADD
jgi:hypothetical protein